MGEKPIRVKPIRENPIKVKVMNEKLIIVKLMGGRLIKVELKETITIYLQAVDHPFNSILVCGAVKLMFVKKFPVTLYSILPHLGYG